MKGDWSRITRLGDRLVCCMGADLERCPNHDAYKCQKCGRVFDREEIVKHMKGKQ